MNWSALKIVLLGSLLTSVQLFSGAADRCFGIQSATNPVNSFQVASSAKTIATRLTRFNVPFRINQNDVSFLEVQLFLSRDEGRSWQFYGRQKTDSTSFPFVADGDGAYWFAVKTLDRNRQLLPDGKITQPELKVHVDTEVPRLEARVESDAAGRVICYWRAEDDNLLADSVRILYQENIEGFGKTDNWVKVPIQLRPQISGKTYTDQLGWWPETSVPYLNIRMEISDTAGNIARADRTIVVRQVAAMHNNQSTAVRLPEVAQQPTQFQSPQPQTAGAPKGTAWGAATEPVCQGGVCQTPETAGPDPRDYRESLRSSVQTLDDQPYRLVGSPAEFAMPPSPDPLVGTASASPPKVGTIQEGRRVDSAAMPSDGQRASIEWPSESQTAASQLDQNNGSTQEWNSHPDVPSKQQPLIQYNPVQRQAAPIEPMQSRGESFVRQQGDLVISQSTTRGRGKQFGVEGNQVAQEGDGQQAPLRSVKTAASRLPNASVPTKAEPAARNTNEFAFRDKQELSVSETEIFRQAISNKRFQLQYGVQSVDPAAVSRVVLWMTRDGGLNWVSWATDTDRVSPFPVQVQESGTYGFQIVVHSADGLTGRAPAPGDRPDMIVDVDTTRPAVQFLSAPYGRGAAAGKMVLNWRAQDLHFVSRPIRLLYSATPSGPWTVIEEGLRNTGSYLWAVDKRTPSQVYLRIEARDQAGNLGVHQLQTPIDLAGLVPRGKIFGLQQMGEGQ